MKTAHFNKLFQEPFHRKRFAAFKLFYPNKFNCRGFVKAVKAGFWFALMV